MNRLRLVKSVCMECRKLSQKAGQIVRPAYKPQATITDRHCMQSPWRWNSNQQNRLYKTASSMQPDTIAPWESGKVLHIEWPDGSKSRFHSVWLRHNCHCPDCKQKDSGQKTLDIANISPDVTIESAKIKGSDVEVRWSSGHLGVIPHHYLLSSGYDSDAQQRRAQEVRLTKDCTATSIPTMAYTELTQSQNSILKWLMIINKYGYCIVSGVPTEDKMVQQVAEMIDKPQFTIYGDLFDVKSSPEPINIAYTTVGLDLHMDLVYYESPPGLQLLHALRFDECVEGGDNVFLDSFQAAEDFREQHPEDFQSLVDVPATFQKVHYSRESPVHMTYQRPHIVLNRNKEIVNVNWSPPFEGALSVPEGDVERYYRAYHKFAVALKESPHRITQKMREGDLVIFNNRRILHGRLCFELNGGVRHLKGCYVNIDHFKSKLQVLSNTTGDGSLAKRVGNQDWF